MLYRPYKHQGNLALSKGNKMRQVGEIQITKGMTEAEWRRVVLELIESLADMMPVSGVFRARIMLAKQWAVEREPIPYPASYVGADVSATPEPAAPVPACDGILSEILQERMRQVAAGKTFAEDDALTEGQLASGAACYAIASLGRYMSIFGSKKVDDIVGMMWDFTRSFKWPDPATSGRQRATLVKAAAMLVAEIERRDRAAAAKDG